MLKASMVPIMMHQMRILINNASTIMFEAIKLEFPESNTAVEEWITIRANDFVNTTFTFTFQVFESGLWWTNTVILTKKNPTLITDDNCIHLSCNPFLYYLWFQFQMLNSRLCCIFGLALIDYMHTTNDYIVCRCI